jgi:hypothetical protein
MTKPRTPSATEITYRPRTVSSPASCPPTPEPTMDARLIVVALSSPCAVAAVPFGALVETKVMPPTSSRAYPRPCRAEQASKMAGVVNVRLAISRLRAIAAPNTISRSIPNRLARTGKRTIVGISRAAASDHAQPTCSAGAPSDFK